MVIKSIGLMEQKTWNQGLFFFQPTSDAFSSQRIPQKPFVCASFPTGKDILDFDSIFSSNIIFESQAIKGIYKGFHCDFFFIYPSILVVCQVSDLSISSAKTYHQASRLKLELLNQEGKVAYQTQTFRCLGWYFQNSLLSFTLTWVSWSREASTFTLGKSGQT